jgi:CDP-diacylglycerol--serine O-phosphatidyltransferase
MIKKNIPNLFTLCNLLCGCIAIVFAFEGNLVWSAYMVGIACIFDFLDGLVARTLQVNSEIGKQLDSLADMVSFGVVPGIILWQWIKTSLYLGLQDKIMAGIESGTIDEIEELKSIMYLFLPMCGFLVTIFSAIRLAKFNLDTRQSDSFIGLPTPANAIFIASLYLSYKGMRSWSCYDSIEPIIHNPYFYVVLTLISSFLLVAPLPLFALKFKNFSWGANKVRYIFLALAAALLIIFRLAGIPLIIVLYIILSVINNLISKNAHTKYE